MSELETLMQEIGRYQDALVAEREKVRKLEEELFKLRNFCVATFGTSHPEMFVEETKESPNTSGE